MDEQRRERLLHDYQILTGLRSVSTIFDMTEIGNPPDRYTWIFRGTGPHRPTSSNQQVELVQEHQVDVRLPFSYPDRPPDIRWLTPVFHPNVSFSGFVHLQDLSLPWNRRLEIDVVVERIWDVARLAFVNLPKATNYAARNWLRDQTQFQLPLDIRPLRDKSGARVENSNVVRYERRAGRERPAGDVFYIGEDTPTPPLPRRAGLPRERRFGDDGILFIDEE